MKITLTILFLTISSTVMAQLSFKDINGLVNPLTKGMNVSEPQVIGLIDSLETKGEIFQNKHTSSRTDWLYRYTTTTLNFENLVDTVRKEKVQLIAVIDQDNNAYYKFTVTTRDYALYNQWISAVAHDGSFIIHRDQQTDFSHRIWTTYLPGTEKRSWDFTATKVFDRRTRKDIFIYQATYSRVWPYKVFHP